MLGDSSGRLQWESINSKWMYGTTFFHLGTRLPYLLVVDEKLSAIVTEHPERVRARRAGLDLHFVEERRVGFPLCRGQVNFAAQFDGAGVVTHGDDAHRKRKDVSGTFLPVAVVVAAANGRHVLRCTAPHRLHQKTIC